MQRQPGAGLVLSSTVLLAGLAGACSEITAPVTSETAEPRIRGSGLTLALEGPGVAQFPTPKWYREELRFVLRGEPLVGGGCKFHSQMTVRVGEAKPGEWVLYQHLSSCLQVRARGALMATPATFVRARRSFVPARPLYDMQAYDSGDPPPPAFQDHETNGVTESVYLENGVWVTMLNEVNSNFRYYYGPVYDPACILRVWGYGHRDWTNAQHYDVVDLPNSWQAGYMYTNGCRAVIALSSASWEVTYIGGCFGSPTTAEMGLTDIVKLEYQSTDGYLHRIYDHDNWINGSCYRHFQDFQYEIRGATPAEGPVIPV